MACRLIILSALLLFALPAPAQDGGRSFRFANPGEALVLEFEPMADAKAPEERHARVDQIWNSVLAANGFYTIGSPTKTATGTVRERAYNPDARRYFDYQILYTWNHTARVTFLGMSDMEPLTLFVPLVAMRSLEAHLVEPGYCRGGRDHEAFIRLSPAQKRAEFGAGKCDPAAYRSQWTSGTGYLSAGEEQ